jgi:hypothetical protein
MEDQVFQLLVDKIDKLESKIDDLIRIRWSNYGIFLAISSIIGIGFQIIIAYISNHQGS